ncbi:MAG: histidine kinase [Saprospiraceae bacterium]|nr:histidine kinase [Saprospiraceae bacterium]
MVYRVQIIFILCLMFLEGVCQKPQLSFRNLDYRDGLPQSEFPEEMIEDHLGRIWIGYTNGLYCYDGISVTHFSARIDDSTSLSENRIQSLYMDPDHKIWIGTRNTGINVYDSEKGRFTRIMPVDQGGQLPIPRIWGFLEDQDSILWIIGKPGIVKHNLVLNSYEHIQYEDKSLSPMELEWTNTFRSIKQDPVEADILWIGTRAGLLSFSKSSKRFIKHPMPAIPQGITSMDVDYMVMDMVFSSPYDLWCATWAGGLMQYNTNSKLWAHHREVEIPSEEQSVYCIGLKDKNTLWVGSRKLFGTYHIPTQQYEFYENNKDDPSSLAYGYAVGSYLFTRDSALIVASAYALSIASYAGYIPDMDRTQPFISDIWVNDEMKSFPSSAPYLKSFSLREDENSIRFMLGWPVFIESSELMWRYKLEGIDKDWIESSQNSVHYPGLKGRKYTFHYEASLDGINWSSGRTTPEFSIHIPFWKQPLFILFNVIIVGGILYFFYKIRIEGIRKEVDLKSEYNKRINELEMAALRAQMNPHFLFNALNSIKSYILKEDKRAASRYLTKFSRLMRTILNNSKQKFITLKEELDALQLFIEFEELRFSKNFLYEINVDENIEKDEIYLPPLMIQPFVENAIWHGLMHKDTQGKLQIKVYKQQDVLKISVKDDGVGRQKSLELKSKSGSKKKSYGLQITDDRIKLIKDKFGIDSSLEILDLYNDTNKAAGTEIILTIPVLTRMDIEN